MVLSKFKPDTSALFNPMKTKKPRSLDDELIDLDKGSPTRPRDKVERESMELLKRVGEEYFEENE